MVVKTLRMVLLQNDIVNYVIYLYALISNCIWQYVCSNWLIFLWHWVLLKTSEQRESIYVILSRKNLILLRKIHAIHIYPIKYMHFLTWPWQSVYFPEIFSCWSKLCDHKTKQERIYGVLDCNGEFKAHFLV